MMGPMTPPSAPPTRALAAEIDPVRFEVIRNGLLAITVDGVDRAAHIYQTEQRLITDQSAGDLGGPEGKASRKG